MRKTRIAETLSTLGLTQVEIASALGLTQPSIHRKCYGLQEWTLSEVNAVLALAQQKNPDLKFEDIFGATESEQVAS